ncbi:interferon-induced GTP-binding protein Mx [Xylaria flabelliformis]|nr:interferon-induced GTP-binding protein Mx [Xylaria flabelliformis]
MDVGSSMAELQTNEQRRILDTVIALRKCGLDKILSLPQIVVCGDQSSGKSSVLEALTEIPFPRSDNLCTRFATEISLRREATNKLTIRIIPDDARLYDEQQEIKLFSQSITNFEDLPKVMDVAMMTMGISNTDGAFNESIFKDILSIEIEGPSQPQVTLVDIPGLISASVKGDSDADITKVAAITDRYISQPRTICLAIVQASNDFANQSILQKVRKFDPEGERTLGVITKVDDPPVGSGREAHFLELAKNEVVVFKLGWHVIKNRKFEERDFTIKERNTSEVEFFERSIFGSLHKDNIGIGTLRTRLSRLLLEHTKNQLPLLSEELEGALQSAKAELGLLGDSRSTLPECRGYLTQLIMECHNICKASIHGHYENQYFRLDSKDASSSKAVPSTTRLRAAVQRANTRFAEKLRTRGHKYTIKMGIFDEDPSLKGLTGDLPTVLSKADAKKWAQTMLIQSRGTELVGNLNPQLIAELFWEQSSPWEKLANEHVDKVWGLCVKFLDGLVTKKVPKYLKTRFWSRFVGGALNERRKAASDELKKIMDDNKFAPINYNHYYTDTLQKRRDDRLKPPSQPTSGTVQPALATPLQITKNMETFSCEEALDCLMSIYKVQEKVFLANVTTQVVERHIMKGLDDIFSPLEVAKLSDDTIKAIVAESEFITRQRDALTDKIRKLEEGREIFRGAMSESTLFL